MFQDRQASGAMSEERFHVSPDHPVWAGRSEKSQPLLRREVDGGLIEPFNLTLAKTRPS